MPIYIFKNPNANEYVEVIQKMSDEHVFIDDVGTKWERVWTVPNASIDSIIKVDSSKQFAAKTKGWSLGEMWDYSSDLSQERKSKRGHDHIGEAHAKAREQEHNEVKERRRLNQKRAK